MDESAITTVIELERQLQSPAVRADSDGLLELLAPRLHRGGSLGTAVGS
ncbi:hypothetical protein LP422_09505 [Janibacter limosus]|uniref:Uncharacterized protein n=1 Tax=Janibacter limosus TaxID=53458 RepID=A0AC61U7M9_9MICO|nr:hypothetical protein [Janibacter limosus]UUZ46055.1 hypothetical protein LP422_09505 [Janibacter limosus]